LVEESEIILVFTMDSFSQEMKLNDIQLVGLIIFAAYFLSIAIHFSGFINLFCRNLLRFEVYVYFRHIVFFRIDTDILFHYFVLEKVSNTKSKLLARYHFVLVGLLGFFDCLFLLRAVEAI
jgi:hypothetical protein